MYMINPVDNCLEPLDEVSFASLGFKERQHLQEWIAKCPHVLGEDLLIIQKEFDGFDGTRERLDLLAIDKDGALVIIENKLDDSGKDVTWQSLKYAAYCSTLSPKHICDIFERYCRTQGEERDTESILSAFLETDTPLEVLEQNSNLRIMMVAGNFRKEVTATALWLMQQGLQIQCFQVEPHKVKDTLLLSAKQIIPVKEAEEFMIRMAEKQQEQAINRTKRKSDEAKRRRFWESLLQVSHSKTSLFEGRTTGKDTWLYTRVTDLDVDYTYRFSERSRSAAVVLSINGTDAEQNKSRFEEILQQKEAIESALETELTWQSKEGQRSCQIIASLPGLYFSDEASWPEMIDSMTEMMQKMEKVMTPYLSATLDR